MVDGFPEALDGISKVFVIPDTSWKEFRRSQMLKPVLDFTSKVKESENKFQAFILKAKEAKNEFRLPY
ncbi:uncharacterized protein OCT59_021858 [Rhizophagus irregularis]|uniref:uncharacterized protein n=1 Tax=Rhizophagus irregularis TaxID=588596 RepID=UPI00331D4222|nr:hypothetical protein OCT59_021858 [Rhizophagus irregularis]